MNDTLNRILAKRLGAAPADEDGKSNPLLLSLLKSMGVDPEQIAEHAKGIGNQVTASLASIDVRLERILAIQLTLEMKFAEMESNVGILLDRHDNESQFADMATHPLTEPIDDLQPLVRVSG